MNSLTLWLGSEQGEAPGYLQFELFRGTSDTQPRYQVTLSTGDLSTKKPFLITFPAQGDPPGQAYYIQLHAIGKSVQVFGRLDDIYPQGDLFVDQTATQADLAFRTTYTYNWASFLEDLKRWTQAAWLVIPLSLLLLVPGWLLFDLTGFFNDHDLGEKIALSLGASLGIVPLLMLWTTSLKLPWDPTALWFVLGFLSAVLTIRQLLRIRKFPADFHPSPILYALFFIFFLSLAVRLVMVRDYATPAWVDSVHHGLITRLILAQGSYPASYAPYINTQVTEYHPGFHSLLASFIWLSGLSIDKAMLILGQVLNALAIFSSYLFTNSLLSDRRAGLIAAAITGLFTPMPAYYTSWGRYTQLAGMFVLPVFFSILKMLWEFSIFTPSPSSKKQYRPFAILVYWKPLLNLCLVSAGLFLIHYRVAGFAFFLATAYWICQPPLKLSALGRKLLIATLAALGAFLFCLPWSWTALTYTLLPKLSIPGSTQPFFSGFTWQYLTSGWGVYILALAIFGLVTGISLRKPFAFTLFLWNLFLFLLPNLPALGLPGGSLVNHTSVEISLYLPFSVLAGYFLSQSVAGFHRYPPRKLLPFIRGFFLALGVFFCILGAKRMLTLLNPVTILTRQSDLSALTWIQTNLPGNETIAINPFLWGYGIYAGNDGGYWITPLTGHPTLPPPVLYGMGSREVMERINQLCAEIIAQGENASSLAEIFRQNNIRFIYLGVRGGAISPSALKDSPYFNLLYQANGSWVFEVVEFP